MAMASTSPSTTDVSKSSKVVFSGGNDDEGEYPQTTQEIDQKTKERKSITSRSSQQDRSQAPQPKHLSKWKQCLKWFEGISVHQIYDAIHNRLQKLTDFPLVSTPAIYFDEDGIYGPNGEKLDTPPTTSGSGTTLTSEELEIEANYDKGTKAMLEIIVKHRKDSKAMRESYHTVKVEMNQFPEWTDVHVERLRTTFQVFDISGDGVVTFDELCVILAEFGDTSPEAVKRQYFDAVSDDSSSIGFLQFLHMVYNVTVNTPSDPESQSFAQAFRIIDRNMGRVRSLDVVQQLQAGLF